MQDRAVSKQFRELHESNNRTPELFKNEIITIRNLWEQLGVVESYKQIFENVVQDLDIAVRKDFLEFEISSLSKFNEQLTVRYIV